MSGVVSPPCTLLIRHLPASLTDEDKESLLQHFGASKVRIMPTKGRMKHTGFASFATHEEAKTALSRLHQLEVLDCRLTAEFSKSQLQSYHPKITEDYGIRKKVEKKDATNESQDNEDKEVGGETIAAEINSFAPVWQMEYPMNPRLKYMYPAPSMSILTNIANALASVPRFYVQVLHLMNRMNLPAPFGPLTATPPLAEEQPPPLPTGQPPHVPPDPDMITEEDMEVSSEEESEIESDEDNKDKPAMPIPQLPKKRKAKHPIKAGPQLKFQKIVDSMNLPKAQGIVQKPEDVFDQPQAARSKKGMEFKISSVPGVSATSKVPAVVSGTSTASKPHQPMSLYQDILEQTKSKAPTSKSIKDLFRDIIQKYKDRENINSDDVLGEILNVVEKRYQPGKADDTGKAEEKNILPDVLLQLEKYQGTMPAGTQVIRDLEGILNKAQEPQVEEGGFGKIEPVAKDTQDDASDDSEGEVEEWGSGKFISSRRLRKGRISRSEMKTLNVFKNYNPGEPTSRLYLKNLHSKTTEQDLHYIYGRYVDWENEIEKTMFDIRLMKEGRMKGQAFITLGDEKKAVEAVEDTNRFELNGKPIVVQFARSAKPKEGDGKGAGAKGK